MSDPDYSVSLQILRMLRLLERSGRRAMSVTDLAEALEVHPRTVKRWASALQDGMQDGDGRPLVRRELRQGRAWIALSQQGPPLSATVFQYACARAAVDHLGGPEGSLLSDAAEGVVARAEQAVPDHLQALVERVDTAFCAVPFAPKDYRRCEDLLDTLLQAVLRNTPVELDYRRADGVHLTRRVEPYTVVLYRESLYLLGRHDSDDDDGLRTYAVDRLQDVRLLRGERFVLPRGFEPAATFARNLGLWRTDRPEEAVALRFSPQVVDAVRERTWAGFQGWEEAEDGGGILRLELPVTPELRTWVLSWGKEVEVLAPPALRDEVVDELTQALAAYQR